MLNFQIKFTGFENRIFIIDTDYDPDIVVNMLKMLQGNPDVVYFHIYHKGYCTLVKNLNEIANVTNSDYSKFS